MVRQLDAFQTMRRQEKNRLQAGAPSAALLETLEAHITFLDEQINRCLIDLDAVHAYGVNHRHNIIRQHREYVNSLHVFDNLFWTCRAHNGCADVGVFETPGQCQTRHARTEFSRDIGPCADCGETCLAH